MTTRRLIGVLGASGLAALLAGCPGVDPRTSNQGGGSILTAIEKVVNEKLSTITADEIQIATDVAITLSEAPIDPVPDDVAQVLADILKDNELNSLDSVQNAIDNPDDFQITEDQAKILAEFVVGVESNMSS